MWSRRGLLQASGGAVAAALAWPAAARQRRFAVPIAQSGERLVCMGTIGGRALRFALDTGANIGLIGAPLARQLGLATVGSRTLTVARRFGSYPIVRAQAAMLGNSVAVDGLLFAAVDPAILGTGADASLSAAAMTMMDGEIDFVRREWILFPDGGPARDGWQAHRGALVKVADSESRYLFGEVLVGEARFKLGFDTGAPTPLRLSPGSASRAFAAWRDLPWSPEFKGSGGTSRIVRLPVPLRIGALTIERPLVAVGERPGLFEAGLVGLPLIGQLNLATEFAAGRLHTRPNGLPAKRWDYNRAGLWVERKGSAMRAGAVGRGSPAEQAGIKPGETIGGIGFEPLIGALQGPAGSAVAVRIGSEQRAVTLTLRDYL